MSLQSFRPFDPFRLPVAVGGSTDPDAADYCARIVSAGSTISANNRAAVNAFIVGCKADGIWTAIKAACFLAGPDDLTGALVPLVGTAPTNNGPFVSGDYNRTTGLVGNGSTKYLNANRNNNADPQDSNHSAIYITQAPTIFGRFLGAGVTSTGSNMLSVIVGNVAFRNRNGTASNRSISNISVVSGFVGCSRSSSGSFNLRFSGSSSSASITSESPFDGSIEVFRVSTNPTNSRLSFYSIGESLDLAALDARLATYMSAIT